MAELNPVVKTVMQRLKQSKTAKNTHVRAWKELDEFYRGEQYKSVNMPPWVPKPVTNFIHLVVTTKRAALSAENPMATLRPMSYLDVENIKRLQQIYEWVWKRSKARNVLRDNIETSRLLGTGIAHVYWEERTGVRGGTGTLYEGEICTKEIDPMNFDIDPNAYRLEDAAWINVKEKRNRRWVEQQFGVSLKEEHTEQDNYGEEYNRSYFRNKEDETEQMIDFHAHYEKYWNTEKSKEMIESVDDSGQIIEEEVEGEEIGGWNYKVTYIAGNKVLSTIDPLEPNMYPFAILYDYKQRQEFWALSTASLIIDNQKLINKVEAIVALLGTLLQNPQKVVTKSSGINPMDAMKYSSSPGHVWVTNDRDAAGSMRWQEVPQIPPALINLAEMAKQNIREITGLNEAYTGQSVGSLQTSSGVNSLIDRATMRDRDQMYDIEQYVDQLSRLLIAFATTKYTEERHIRLVDDPNNPEATTQFIQFLGTDFAGIDYDMEIDVSGRAPITQARREAELTELIQLQGQYGYAPAVITPQEFIKGKNMVDADKIINRMNKEEMQSRLDMLTQVYNMTAEAAIAQVPVEEILQMAQQQLQALESGQVPTDPNAPQGGIGSAANNIQAQQGAL